jgi:type 1 glutamine amidotransferase/glucose/arabinose dehydrogenase
MRIAALLLALCPPPPQLPPSAPGAAPGAGPDRGAAAAAQPSAAERERDFEPGLTLRLFASAEALERVLAPLPDQSPNLDELRPAIDLSGAEDFGGFEQLFVAEVSCALWLEAPGRHAFRITSDDGSYLEIDGRQVLLHDGEHAASSKECELELAAGLHRLRLLMFQNQGQCRLALEWRPPGRADFELLSAPAALTERGVTRVVAPGPKLFAEALGDRRPGDGLPLAGCHPGWRVEPLRPEGFEPKVGALGWLPDGRLGVATFDPKNNGERLAAPNGTLWALSNLTAEDPREIQAEVVAEGLYHPLGLLTVDGRLLVAERDQISRLEDRDGDGRYEHRERFAGGWVSDNYHHFTFGLERVGDRLYSALSTSIGAASKVQAGVLRGINGPNPPLRGCLLEIDLAPDLAADQRLRALCGGFRTPNGLLAFPDGTALVADNQGAWKPASRIDHARPGHFFGHYNETRVLTADYPEGGVPALFSERPETPPAIWLPQGEIANSPSGMVWMPAGPFNGQFLFGELKLGGIQRAFLEEVEGQFQGGALRFTQGLEGGVNRLLWAPDGRLIVGMTGESASWSWRGTTFGLQRLVPTGGGAFEILRVGATPRGLRIDFTEAPEAGQLGDLERYRVRSWRYRASPEYGGDKLDERDHRVLAVYPDPDGFGVELELEGLAEGTCVHLRADLASQRGEALWSTECWYTLNRIPGRPRPLTPPPQERGVLVFSKTAGFRHDSIEAGVQCLRELSAELGLDCEASEDADIFDDADLQRFRLVVFLSTTGDVLDLRQEAALERFIRAGGGFFGIHAAADTEYDWPFYRELVGAQFASHPAIQRARLRRGSGAHPAIRALPESFEREDEWYDFRALPAPEFERLLELDESTYQGGTTAARFGSHPIAWCRTLGSARLLYTGGGHTRESFSEPLFRAHLLGALAWVARCSD